MKTHNLTLTCFILILFNLFSSCSYNGGNPESKILDDRFLGIWVQTGVLSVNNHKPTIADTASLESEDLIITKTTDSIKPYSAALYEYPPILFVGEDDETLKSDDEALESLKLGVEIKYIDSIHLFYDWHSDNEPGIEFIKLK